jgi:nitrogen-specific signal transduction histidine kinase
MEAAQTEGTKLGQRLIRSLAAQLGGRMELRSSTAGTTAEVRFPAIDALEGAAAAAVGVTPDPQRRSDIG